MPLTAKQQAILRGCFLFEGAEPALVSAFLSGLTADAFAGGCPIYTAGSFQKSIGILTKGAVVVRGMHNVVLNTLSVGGCFGAAALFHPGDAYVTTVQAKTAAEVVFISDTQLTLLFRQAPETALNYISFLSRRICFLNRKIQSFTTPTAAAGLALYLLENQRDGVVSVSCGYAGLARGLGMGRASLYRSLEQLEQAGVIFREARTIRILDAGALQSG